MTQRMAFRFNSLFLVIIAFNSLVGVYTEDQSLGPESRSSESDPFVHSENFEASESLCRGEWKSPQTCNTFNCDYKANWEYIDETDDIVFTISTKNRNKWTGIGFSENQAMPETDAILGLVEESGRFFLMDSWLRAYEAPPLDPQQNLHNMTAWRENGITTLKFARKRITGDNRDFQFSDTNCPYLIFPVMGGVFNAVNKRIRKHEITPIISDRKVCIRSCKPSTVATVPANTGAKQDNDDTIKPPIDESNTKDSSTTQTSQTTETSKTSEIEEITDNLYKIEMKFPGILKQSLGEKNSNQYQNVLSIIKQQMVNELNKNYPTYSQFNVNELTVVESETNSVIASMDLAVKPMDDQTDETEAAFLSTTLNSMISDQLLGDLKVDPKYLIVARKEDENGKNIIAKDNGINFFGDDQTKWMIIFVGIAALVGLVLIQAFCMLLRGTGQKDTKQKNDKQSPNSQWKDYAAVNARTGYGYDNYGASEETDNPIKPNGQSLGRGEKPNSSKHLYKNTAEKMPQKYLSATLERQPSRPHRSQEFTSAYATHDRNAPYNRTSYAQPSYLPQLQPDFYFMPHQRRYSGEVVRVFVDYNNPQFTPK